MRRNNAFAIAKENMLLKRMTSVICAFLLVFSLLPVSASYAESYENQADEDVVTETVLSGSEKSAEDDAEAALANQSIEAVEEAETEEESSEPAAPALVPIQTRALYSTPSNVQASGTNGGCSWYITSDDDPTNPSQLVIYPTNGTSGTLDETAKNTVVSPWDDYAELPKSIYIAEGVTTGTEARYLFSNFSNLKTADVGNFIFGESTRQINGMFYNCSNLQSVNTDGWDLSSITNLDSLFHGCKNLGSIDMSKWDTSKTTSLSALFYGCSSLTTVDLTPLEMGSLETIASMFYNCKNLQSVTGLSGRDTPNLTALNTVFSGCRSLPSIDVTGLDTGNVKVFSDAFCDCTNLKSIIGLNTWDTTSATRFYGMFDGCSSLESIDVSSFNTSNGQLFDLMFADCTSLKSLDLSGFSTSKATSFYSFLKSCENITSLDLSGFDTSKVTKMERFFYGMNRLSKVTLGTDFNFDGNGNTGCTLPTPDPEYLPGVTGNWQAVGSGTAASPAGSVYAPADVPSNVAETYVVEKAKEPVLAETNSWYKGTALKSTYTAINIVDSYSPTGSEKESWDASAAQDSSVMAYVSADGKTLTIAGNGSGYVKANVDSTYAFLEFSAVTAINGIDLLDVSETESMKWMFKRCNALTSLDLDDWDVSNVTNMDAIFNECHSLTSFGSTALGNWETGKVKNMSHAFTECSSLKALDVSGWDTSSCTDMSWMFYECESLKTLDVSGFDTSKVKNFKATFYDCSNLEVIDVSKWSTGNTTDFSFMFNKCEKVKELNVSSFNTSKATNMSVMFGNCEAITALDLSNFNTSGVVDMNYMFSGNTALASVDLSSFDTSKCKDFEKMFYNCASLKTLNIGNFDTASATSMENMFGKMVRLQQITLGKKFSFTGNGTATGCVLPTPDPAYIPGANGKWQAVGTGTVNDPQGQIYTPDAVPNNTAETYVMPKLVVVSIDVPVNVNIVCDSEGNWCTPSALKNRIVNHSTVAIRVVSASASPALDFGLLAADAVESSSKSNVFGGTIQPDGGTAQDLSAITCPAAEWTMDANSSTNGDNQLALQLDGSIQNSSGHYFTAPLHVFDITYVFDTVS